MPRGASNAEVWREAFRVNKGCVFKTAIAMGCCYGHAMQRRREILGPHWRHRGSVRNMPPEHLDELRAAILAKINLQAMADRFGCGIATLHNIIKAYGLPRMRKPYKARKPSKTW